MTENKKRLDSVSYLNLILATLFFLLPFSALADTFDLSCSLVEGGYRLELNQNSPYKGVKIEVNSDVSARYEVSQKVIAPLENRDKPGSTIKDNLVFRSLRGFNKYGDLRVPSDDTRLRMDEIVYVSSAAGDADSFTLIFGINKIEDIDPGYYFGRIAFVLNPIGSTQAQVTKILDVYVNVSEKAEAKPRIEIFTESGSRNIVLNPAKEEMHNQDVLIKINGKFKESFSIIQFLAQPFDSEDGNKIDSELINFVVKEADKGVSLNRPTVLSAGVQNIYTSMPSGEADDYFIISYGLQDLAGKKAGRYRSRIQYLLEERGMQKKLDTLEFEIVFDRIFDLLVNPADQKFAIEFLDVKPTEPVRRSEVEIEVLTNTGKRYQVSQEVLSELTSSEGQVVPAQYFTMYTQGEGIKGKSAFLDKEVVKKGSSIVYVSDSFGSPDKFKVIYELECPKDLRAGNYSTRITYSLSEI